MVFRPRLGDSKRIAFSPYSIRTRRGKTRKYGHVISSGPGTILHNVALVDDAGSPFSMVVVAASRLQYS